MACIVSRASAKSQFTRLLPSTDNTRVPSSVTGPRCPLGYNCQCSRCERQQRVKNNSHARDTNTRFGMEGNRALDTRVGKSRPAAAPPTPDQQKHEQNHLHSRQGAGEDERSPSLLSFLSLPSLSLSFSQPIVFTAPLLKFIIFCVSDIFLTENKSKGGRKLDAASSPLPRYSARLKFSHYFSLVLCVWGQRRGG